MKSALMVSWVKRGFSSSAARLAVVLLMLLAALPAQADTVSLIVGKAATGTGAGTVSSTPGSISCGATCYDTFVLDTANPAIVTLSAEPAANSIFAGWQYYEAGLATAHACNSTSNSGTCVVVMDKNRTMVAKFTYDTTAIGLTVITDTGTGSGTVTTDPGPMYCAPSCYESFALALDTSVPPTATPVPVTLTATPAPGSKVASWSGGGCSGTGKTCVVTMAVATTVTVQFNTDPNAKNLSVIKTGTGTGIVRSNPLGIYCGAFCNETYTLDTLVTLSATPDSGSTFTGWTLPDGAGGTTPGSCIGIGSALTDLSCVLKMDASKSVKANFDVATSPTGNTLYLYKLGTGSGAVTSDPAGISCLALGCTDANAKFTSGTPVTLTATHAQGSTFTGWSGGGSAVAVSSVAVDKTAKTVTLTLASPVTSGQSVTVAYTDPTTGNDGNAIQDLYGTDAISLPATTVTNLTGVAIDTSPPSFVQATVDGNTLIMSYADAAHNLDSSKLPALDAFSIQVGSTPFTVSEVQINDLAKTVTLILAPPPSSVDVQAGQSVTVAYSRPTAGDSIQDVAGNAAASLAKTVVTNLTGEPVGFLRPTFALAKVDGTQLVMSYTGPSNLNDINLPVVGAFIVEVGGVNGCIGTATTCAVTMSKAQTVIATFDGVPPSFFTIHIGKMGSGNGTIKSSGTSQDPIDCGTDCDGSFSLGTPVVLKAVANSDSNFTGWTGCTNVPSVTDDCSVLKTANDIYIDGTSFGVTASFVSVDYPVTLTFLGNGTGSISATTGGNSTVCTGLCSKTYSRGATVTLVATAVSGSTFIGWGGSCVDSTQSATCEVKMDAAKNVTATFGKSVTINTTASPVAGGSVSCVPQTVNYGANSICTATENLGYKIAAWSGCTVATGTTCSLTNVTATQNVTATFTNSYLITATADPTAGGTVSCTPNPVNHGSRSNCTVTKTNTGYSFKNWSGDCSGATCSMGNVTADKAVQANFTPNTYAVSATASPPAGGTVNCTPNPVEHGLTSTCTATATPSSGYSFTGWSGACSGTTSPCTTIAITANQSVTALFVETSKIVTTTTLSASPASSGKTTTLAVRVIPSGTATGTPTGSVVFKNDNLTLGTVALSSTGSASYSSNFGVGLHSLSASYAGDTAYLPSQSSLIYQVGTLDALVAVSTRPNRSQPGISVPVTVNVTSASNAGNISGTVEVSGDGQSCSITLPATSCTLTFASKGTKKLTARYSGNSSYSPASGSSVHFVGTQPSMTPILLLLLD